MINAMPLQDPGLRSPYNNNKALRRKTMPSPNVDSTVQHLEEECVLSLLALKQNRSVTPELNANSSKPEAKTTEPSPLPVTTELTYPEKTPNDLPTTQPTLLMGNHAAASANDLSTLHAANDLHPTSPTRTTRSGAPTRSGQLLPNNLVARTCTTEQVSEAQLSPSNAFKLTKRKRIDRFLLRTTLVPIVPYGWEPDQDFDDKTPDTPLLQNYPRVSIETVLGDSPLVKKQDRNLVPDALFVAMAQMKPCRLTVADQTGSYKKLDIGFVGFCCKHCGGQPGFGRYFPSTQRSCAQTTSSQTILKHIDSKCCYVPNHIRHAVLELESVQQAKELSHELGRPRYGARKVFFERIWKRLHQHSFSHNEDKAPVEQNETPALDTTDEDEKLRDGRETRQLGMLPTKKNVQNLMVGLDGSKKRARAST